MSGDSIGNRFHRHPIDVLRDILETLSHSPRNKTGLMRKAKIPRSDNKAFKKAISSGLVTEKLNPSCGRKEFVYSITPKGYAKLVELRKLSSVAEL